MQGTEGSTVHLPISSEKLPPTTLSSPPRRYRHRRLPFNLQTPVPAGRNSCAGKNRPTPSSRLVNSCSTSAAEVTPVLPLPVWKRVTDMGVVFLTLPIIAVLSALICCWIKIVSPGPALFRQVRIGRGGRRFTLYKFRSMHLSADPQVHEEHVERLIRFRQPMVKLDAHGDTRLIRGGVLLRTSGLDELPQLFNVLRGEMSLVGPRPCLPTEFDLYHSPQHHRFVIPPGLTGLWQVNRTDSTTFGEMVKMDNDYVQKLAPWRDCQILLKTPYSLLRKTTRLVGIGRLGNPSGRFFALHPQKNFDCKTSSKQVTRYRRPGSSRQE